MRPIYYIAFDWAKRCFPKTQMENPQIRALRLAEEVFEFAQATDLPKEKLKECIDIVYSRPIGSCEQELGGIMLTAVLLCISLKEDPDEMFDTELRRVLDKPTEHFTKRNKEKEDLGL